MKIFRLAFGTAVAFGFFLVVGCKIEGVEGNRLPLAGKKRGDLPIVEVTYSSPMFTNQGYIKVYSDGYVFADRLVGTNCYDIGRTGPVRILKDLKKAGFFDLEQEAVDLRVKEAAVIEVDGATTTLTVRLWESTNSISIAHLRSLREYCPSVKEFRTFERSTRVVEKAATA